MISVRLVSMAMTGFYRTMVRPRTKRPLSFLKYDPVGTLHTTHDTLRGPRNWRRATLVRKADEEERCKKNAWLGHERCVRGMRLECESEMDGRRDTTADTTKSASTSSSSSRSAAAATGRVEQQSFVASLARARKIAFQTTGPSIDRSSVSNSPLRVR